MVIKKSKVVSLTKSEYEDLKFIIESGSCPKDAMDKIEKYVLELFPNMNKYESNAVSFYCYQAIVYNYKYLKIIE